jgi:hypothetical protein
LTRQESNLATAADVAFLRESHGADYQEGDMMFGGKARLTVTLDRASKRLVRYVDFLRKHRLLVPTLFPPSALQDWWVYLGHIPAHKIDTRLPLSLALECLDHHIATHPDLDARARFQVQRDSLATEDPDALCEFSTPPV